MSSAVEIAGLQRIEIPWNQGVEEVAIGKDVLELLSSSMYVDPMSVYREYVQNSADAIDDARNRGLVGQKARGRVEIHFDMPNRTVRIRDNGTGVERAEFESRMTAFGGSPKRGTKARGFRGVGRLAGIGYCQELVFRTRAVGERQASELKWDCRKIKSVLRATDFKGDLADLVRQVVTWRHTEAKGLPEHFFEVELRGILRQKNDLLLDPKALQTYLAQTAPLPFSPSFVMGDLITSHLESHTALGTLDLDIEGIGRIYRPHQSSFEIKDRLSDSFSDVQFVSIPSVEHGLAGIGWILHHSYKGAIPPSTNVRGLRLRVGNIQVGDDKLLEDLFPEPRFNSWSVGEIHILDQRVTPNGRRDHFEQNVHYLNILNHLGPAARDISQRCRISSVKRNWLRRFELHKLAILETLAVLKQGSLGAARRKELCGEIADRLEEMEKIAARDVVRRDSSRALDSSIKKLQVRFRKTASRHIQNRSMDRLSRSQRQTCETVFSLIYDYSNDAAAARKLVDRILQRLGRS
jgi:hypothetical protein